MKSTVHRWLSWGTWDENYPGLSGCAPYSQVVVLLFSRVWLFVTPWTAAHQASLSFTISWTLLKFMSIESIMPSNHLIFCCPFLLLPSIFPSIRVFSSKSILRIRRPKYWSFSNTVIRCLKRVRGRRCDEEGNMLGSVKDVKMLHCWLWRWKKGFGEMEEWTKEGLYSMYHASGLQNWKGQGNGLFSASALIFTKWDQCWTSDLQNNEIIILYCLSH